MQRLEISELYLGNVSPARSDPDNIKIHGRSSSSSRQRGDHSMACSSFHPKHKLIKIKNLEFKGYHPDTLQP